MKPLFQVIWKRSLVEIQLARVVNSLIESGHSLVPLTDAMAEIDHRLSTNLLGEGGVAFGV
jgi:hypothetical protein